MKKSKKRKKSNTWKIKQHRDIFFKKSKTLGYRSRAAFKLIELNDKFKFIRRNTNLLDTLKITYDTFYSSIWRPMIQANTTGTYTNPSTGITYNLSSPNPGKANAVPTFSGAWGPSVIPIAYLDINQNYVPTPFNPGGGQPFQGIAERPYIANTCAYFTIKFAQPHDNNATNPSVDWKTENGD